MLEGLTFLFPWLLGALVILPALWFLLRALPPRPRTVKLPAFFLLKGLSTPLKAAARTPWWLLLLRCLAAALFILAFAEPVLHPAEDLPGGHKGNVLIVVDNGFAAAANWNARVDKIRETIMRVQRSGRPVIFLPTAPAEDDGHVRAFGPMDAAEAEVWISRLKPMPWPSAPDEAAAVLEETLAQKKITYSVFFSAGVADDVAGTPRLVKSLPNIVADESVNNPFILRQDENKRYTLERLRALPKAEDLRLVAYTRENNVADELKVTFPAGTREMSFAWDMLPEIRSKVARIALRAPGWKGEGMASAVFMTNASWRQHPVGIIADAAQKESRNFLSEVYYLRRALEATGDSTIDTLQNLMKMPLAALVLPDSTALPAAEKAELEKWVEDGGFLIRFAGPNLAAAATEDTLLPVPLRAGQRAMEGAMTWEKPVRLGDIAEQSPLYGLSVPDDVTVTRQVLAAPSPDVFEKTWLQLEDGTPLITGSRLGKGTVVLIHTSAGPDWSTFCYSGLFVESLQRMASLSSGITDYKGKTTLAPLMLMDGFGTLAAPEARTIVTPITANSEFAPSPQTPPGLYGGADDYKAFNLGDALPPLQEIKVPVRASVESYSRTGERDLKALLIEAALALLLLDTIVTFRLRGVLSLLFLLFMLAPLPARAAEDPATLASGLYLAYIETGDQDIDRTSFNGLTGLAEVVSARTTAKIKGVVSLNPDTDDLAYYPVIYWPMAVRQQGLSMTAANNIQNYLAQGGIILFDTRDRQFGDAEGSVSSPGTRKLREMTQSLQIPELTEIPKDHILARSFYLLDDYPGRYAGGKIWVEKEPNPRHDGVTSVIVGANDWAAAWSKDQNDEQRFTIEPGGERQREMSYRFGVNLVMIALTGSYKSDQVHISHILERIGQ